jgi:hypothetical protein
MDFEVNAADERIYSEFRGLLQDGFRIGYRQRTGTVSMKKTVGPTCIGSIISELKRCLVVNHCLIDAFCCFDFRGTLERSGLTAYC